MCDESSNSTPDNPILAKRRAYDNLGGFARYFDRDGNLSYIQSQKQLSCIFTYFLYDAAGRVVETGEVKLSCGLPWKVSCSKEFSAEEIAEFVHSHNQRYNVITVEYAIPEEPVAATTAREKETNEGHGTNFADQLQLERGIRLQENWLWLKNIGLVDLRSPNATRYEVDVGLLQQNQHVNLF